MLLLLLFFSFYKVGPILKKPIPKKKKHKHKVTEKDKKIVKIKSTL